MRYSVPMTLAKYLERHRLSDAEFAEKAGMHRSEVWNYKTGRRQPRAKHVAAIEEATRGRVRAKDLVRAA